MIIKSIEYNFNKVKILNYNNNSGILSMAVSWYILPDFYTTTCFLEYLKEYSSFIPERFSK